MFKPKACKECGLIFQPRNGSQIYCNGPHTTTCTICGKSFEYTCSPKEKPSTCSTKCKEALRSRTAYERYGVTNVSLLPDVQQKISKANKSERVRQHRESTCLRNWGATNPSKSEVIKNKLREIQNSEDHKQKIKDGCLLKYGYTSAMKCPAVIDKRRASCIEKYGQPGPPKLISFYQHRNSDPSKAIDFMEFKEHPREWIQSHFDRDPTIYELCESLGVTDTTLYDILNDSGCADLLNRSHSHIELKVIDFIRSLDPNIRIVENTRSVIKPLEIDIFLPDFKLGIECNPTFTHNSSMPDRGGSILPYTYHQNKSMLAKDAGIFLFHIFGYEWFNHTDIIKSMLRNLLGYNTTKIGARCTRVINLPHNECKNFLDTNHRQGNTSASVRLGLVDTNDILVSVMTFNRMRPGIGRTHNDTQSTWELSRFCNKLGYSVPGGASKLLKHFLQNYDYDKIVSFSDFAHTRGKLYERLGFKECGLSSPGYVWVTPDESSMYTRISCQKKNLPHIFQDVSSDDIKTMTEKQIMESHGYCRVYDSGVIRWEYLCPDESI